MGLPIPSVCLYKEEDNKQIIIDGFQRLESIRLFYSKKFSDGNKLIHATVIKADEPREQNYNAVYLIFERLNTGGVNLTPQKI